MIRYIFKDVFNSFVEKYGSEVLLYDTAESQDLSYSDCAALVRLTSAGLASEGLSKGNVVISYCPLSLEAVILCWACLNNGYIFIPVDHSWPAHLVKQVVDEAEPNLILSDKEGMHTCGELIPKEKILLTGDDTVANSRNFFGWLETITEEAEQVDVDIKTEDLAVILYTSGSIGKPKGVCLSQHTICASGKLIAEFFEWEAGDTFMNLGDLHSMSGLRNTCIAPLFSGSSAIIAREEERNTVLHVIELVHKLNIQYLGIAPTVIRQLNLLYSGLRKEQLSPMKAMLCTAGYLPKDQLVDFYEKYDIPVYNYYGLTETAGICSGHNASTFSPDDNSIGIPVGATFNLFPEEGYDDPNTGLLLVNSDHLMSGYFKREEETARVLSKDGFDTGDIVHKRTDGCFELLGRKKNFVKSIHAELIHLEEIDQALELFPGVREACACSYLGQEEDEKIVAFIVAEDADADERELVDEIKEHMVSRVGKKRSPWCYYIKERLPRNAPGKIERQKLAEEIDALIQSEHTRYF